MAHSLRVAPAEYLEEHDQSDQKERQGHAGRAFHRAFHAEAASAPSHIDLADVQGYLTRLGIASIPEFVAVLVRLIGVLYLFYLLIRPFLTDIFIAMVLAMVFCSAVATLLLLIIQMLPLRLPMESIMPVKL